MPAMDDPTILTKLAACGGTVLLDLLRPSGRCRNGLAGSSCQETGVGACPGDFPGAGYFNKIRRWKSSTAAAGALLAVAFAAARTGLGKRRAGRPRQVGIFLPLPGKLGLERVQRARHGLLEVRAARVLRVQVDHLDHAGRGRGGGARSGASGLAGSGVDGARRDPSSVRVPLCRSTPGSWKCVDRSCRGSALACSGGLSRAGRGGAAAAVAADPYRWPGGGGEVWPEEPGKEVGRRGRLGFVS